MEDPRTKLSNGENVPDSSSRVSDVLGGISLPNGIAPPSSTYLDSDSDSDLDENDTPPTIIKRKSEAPRKPKSKYKGVFRCGKKFKAQIQTNGVQHYLGLFDVEEEAARAYDVHARATLGPKAKTNFVYDANENIVPPDFVVIQTPLSNVPDPANINGEPSNTRSKGSHPRRTYVGIKARRKRLSEVDSHPGSAEAGVEQDSPYSVPSRKRFRNSDESLESGSGSLLDSEGNPIQGETQSEQEDWREQLYHWKGNLSVDISSKTVVWKGTWMTSWQIQQQQEGNAPNPSWNNNTFEYRCSSNIPIPEATKEGLEYPASLPLPPVGGNYSGFYMMDNDDGGVLSRYSDSLCVLDFELIDMATITSEDGSFAPPPLPPPPQSMKYSVVGKGESDFGTFVLQGIYDSSSRELDVTRKYISSFDPRSAMSIPQIREALVTNPLIFPTLLQQTAMLSESTSAEPTFVSTQEIPPVFNSPISSPTTTTSTTTNTTNSNVDMSRYA